MSADHLTSKLVVLSPAQAETLLRMFNRVLRNADAIEHMLNDVRDRLSDSLSISQWLRENISLELNALEVVDLVEAIVVGLHEHAWSDADCTTLQAIVDQLSTASTPLEGATEHTFLPIDERTSHAGCQH